MRNFLAAFLAFFVLLTIGAVLFFNVLAHNFWAVLAVAAFFLAGVTTAFARLAIQMEALEARVQDLEKASGTQAD